MPSLRWSSASSATTLIGTCCNCSDFLRAVTSIVFRVGVALVAVAEVPGASADSATTAALSAMAGVAATNSIAVSKVLLDSMSLPPENPGAATLVRSVTPVAVPGSDLAKISGRMASAAILAAGNISRTEFRLDGSRRLGRGRAFRGRRELAIAIAAGALGLVQRLIGAGDQRRRRNLRGDHQRTAADTQADDVADRRTGMRYRQLDHRRQAGPGNALGGVGVGFRQQDRKFLTAIARDQI